MISEKKTHVSFITSKANKEQLVLIAKNQNRTLSALLDMVISQFIENVTKEDN